MWRDRLLRACMNESCSRFFAYAYDPVGNRISQKTRKATTSYAYDAADELLSESSGKHDLTLYSYDANGNQTISGTTRYAYNLENKLILVQGKSDKVSYTYTAEGLMATRATKYESTAYTWDASSDLPELATETVSKGSGRAARVPSSSPTRRPWRRASRRTGGCRVITS